PAADECLHTRDEVIGGRDDAAGRRGIRRVLARLVVGFECPGSGRDLGVGRIWLGFPGQRRGGRTGSGGGRVGGGGWRWGGGGGGRCPSWRVARTSGLEGSWPAASRGRDSRR